MRQTVKEYAAQRGCSPRTVYEASRHRKFKIDEGHLESAEADKAWPVGESASLCANPRFTHRVITWIQRRGVSRTASQIDVQPRAVWKYIQGSIAPRPEKASQLQALALDEGHTFALEEFYNPTTITKKECK